MPSAQDLTVLMPMNERDYQDFIADTIPVYAADKVAAGQWHPDEALALARESFSSLLPQGLATPDHHLFTMRDAGTGVAVGRLWVGAQDKVGERIAFVYDVQVAPEHRRQGHATRAFVALEDVVRRLGLSGLALHVFGHNLAAQALYAKLGYLTTNINMYKSVVQPPA